MNLQSTINLHSGRAMPVLGLGTWQMKNPADTVGQAIKLGYSMIDTSGDYGTQPGVGEGVKASGVDRSSLFIVTKVEETDNAYEATKKNLGELGMEYVDLILIHRPPPTGFGLELWEGLIKAQAEGLAIDIGVSSYSIDHIKSLIEATNVKPTVNQIEWSPFGYSQAMLDFAHEQGVIIQAYSPLTRGKRLDNEVLREIGQNHNKSSAQIITRWNLQLGVVPIMKSNSRQHLQENIDVFDFELSEDEMSRVSGLNEEYSSMGSGLEYL